MVLESDFCSDCVRLPKVFVTRPDKGSDWATFSSAGSTHTQDLDQPSWFVYLNSKLLFFPPTMCFHDLESFRELFFLNQFWDLLKTNSVAKIISFVV